MYYYGWQVKFVYEMLMVEVVMDFFDKFKLCFKGYVLFDYDFKEYCVVDVVKFDILINSEKVDVLFLIVYCVNL